MGVLLQEYANRLSHDANYKSILDHFIQKLPLSLTATAFAKEFEQQLQSVFLSKPVTSIDDRRMMVCLITGDLVCEAVGAGNIQRAADIFNIPYQIIGVRSSNAPTPYDDFMMTPDPLFKWLKNYETLIDVKRVCDMRVATATLLPPPPAGGLQRNIIVAPVPAPLVVPAAKRFPVPIVAPVPAPPVPAPPVPVPLGIPAPPGVPAAQGFPPAAPGLAQPPKPQSFKILQAPLVMPKPIQPINVIPAPPQQQIIQGKPGIPPQPPKRFQIVVRPSSSVSQSTSQPAKLAKLSGKNLQTVRINIIQPWYKTDPRVTDVELKATPHTDAVIWSYLFERFTLGTFPVSAVKRFNNLQGQTISYGKRALGVVMADFGDAIMKTTKFQEIKKGFQTELSLAKDKRKTFKNLLHRYIISPLDCILYDRVMTAISLTSCIVEDCLLNSNEGDAFAYYLAATDALNPTKHIHNIYSQGWLEMKELREQLVNRKTFDMLYDERLVNPAALPPPALSKAAQNHIAMQVIPDVEHYDKRAQKPTKTPPASTITGPVVTKPGTPSTVTVPVATTTGTSSTVTGPVVTTTGTPSTVTGPVVTTTGTPSTVTGPVATTTSTPSTVTGPVVTTTGTPSTVTGPVAVVPFDPDQFFAALSGPPATAGDPADATTDPADTETDPTETETMDNEEEEFDPFNLLPPGL